MSYKEIKRPTKELLMDLLSKGTNKEVANKLGVSIKTIQRWRNHYGLSREYIKTRGVQLTNFQKELIIAWLLGDGCIPWTPENHLNRFTFKQKKSRKEYVQFVFDNIKPFSSSIYEEKPIKGPIRDKKTKTILQRRGEIIQAISMATIRSHVFQDMRSIWYKYPKEKNSPKVIPDIKFTWTILAFWFADDGCNNPQKKTISFSTNCFNESDVDKLIFNLKRDLEIEGYRKNGPIIVFGAQYYEKILLKLKEKLGNIKCLESKLHSPKNYKDYLLNYDSGFSEELINQIWDDKINLISNLDLCRKYSIKKSKLYRILKQKSLFLNQEFPKARKLKISEYQTIKKLINSGLTQQEVACRFGISQTRISQILKTLNRRSIPKTPALGGTAIVNTIYNQ